MNGNIRREMSSPQPTELLKPLNMVKTPVVRVN